MIKFSLQFVCINFFLAITSRRHFFEELLARRKCFVFFLQTSCQSYRMFFFDVKALTQLLKNFLEICLGNSNIMRFVGSLIFLFAKMIRARSQKQKAAAIAINSYMSFAVS